MPPLSFKTRSLNVLRLAFKTRGLERWLCRHTVGKFVDDSIAKCIPSHCLYKSGTLRQVRRGGLRYVVDLSDYNDWKIYWGLKEPEREKLFVLAQGKRMILDVGTNVGFVLLNMAQAIEGQGRVVGFEPDPINYTRCRKNLAFNDLSNIEVHNVGCGQEPAELHMKVPDANNRGRNTIVQDVNDQDAFPVSVVVLDDFLSNSQIHGVDLIKIDVEGFEMEVLQGARRTIERDKPQMFIELDDANLRRNGSCARELIDWVQQLGYDTYHALDNAPITADASLERAHFDLLCVPRNEK